MGFSNPFRNDRGLFRLLPMEGSEFIFVIMGTLIVGFGVWSYFNLLEVSADCDRRGGVVVKSSWNMPVCVASPPKN